MSEYWWDRSGRDAELERIEQVLSAAALAPAPLLAPTRRRRPGRTAWVAAAALLAALAAGWALHRHRAAPSLQLYPLAGAPTLEGTSLAGRATWHPGQALETGPDSRVKVLIGSRGEVDLEPGSRLRLVRADRSTQRLFLDRGTLRAFILAPPRHFFIDTPSATAVDLGCAYALSVDAQGGGWLRVAFGWVSFENDEREVYVPAGAACALHGGRGPGTPFFEDATAAFRAALDALDRGEPAGALDTLLAQARPQDAFSLLQLLPRLDTAERPRVCEGLTQLVAPPAGVDCAAILRSDPQALGRYWSALGLGEMKWWRLGGDLPAPPNRP